jgi:FAD/FMN-containing dehydrogenase
MGGGIGNLVSNFGLGSDNMISARVVTASGSVVIASKTENADLFWALRGAGHNFGIVSELTVKAYPQINKGQHWSGMLGFPGSKEVAEKVVSTVQEMGITKGHAAEGISCTVVYGRPSPTYEVGFHSRCKYYHRI